MRSANSAGTARDARRRYADLAQVSHRRPDAIERAKRQERGSEVGAHGCEAVRKWDFKIRAIIWHRQRKQPRLAGHGNDRPRSGSRPHHRDGDDRDQFELERWPNRRSWVVHQSDAVLDAVMDDWNQKTHGRSGLIDRVRCVDAGRGGGRSGGAGVHEGVLAKRSSPMCGNSIGQDRRFMARYMPGWSLVPLPEPRCQHPEGTVPALETRGLQGLQ
jgi:hypothetical protein